MQIFNRPRKAGNLGGFTQEESAPPTDYLETASNLKIINIKIDWGKYYGSNKEEDLERIF